MKELVFEEQFGDLSDIAQHRRWDLQRTDEPGFILTLPARDDSRFSVQVVCTDFPTLPPIWSWYDIQTHQRNQEANTPMGSGGYFHGSGRICAPWNRIAYREVDSNGPHSDWRLTDWMSNPNTQGCITLAGMALRVSVELLSPRYHGRME